MHQKPPPIVLHLSQIAPAEPAVRPASRPSSRQAGQPSKKIKNEGKTSKTAKKGSKEGGAFFFQTKGRDCFQRTQREKSSGTHYLILKMVHSVSSFGHLMFFLILKQFGPAGLELRCKTYHNPKFGCFPTKTN